MSTVDRSSRFTPIKQAAPASTSYSPAGAFDAATKAKPSRGGMGGTVARTSAFDASSTSEAASAATFSPPSAFATPKCSGKSAAFSSQSGRFASPAVQGPSASYDTSFGTIGASAQKSASKSVASKGGFGGGAKRDTMAGFGRPSTPKGSGSARGRALKSEELAPVASSFGGKKIQSKGPSAAFGGSGKERFAIKKAAPDTSYTPEGMGNVKKVGKSPSMGGKANRFTPAKSAAPGDYSDAYTSDFSKSKSGKAKANTGFGGTAPRVSAVQEAAAAAAKNAPEAIYDVSSTGAFSGIKASAAQGPSAAFASKSKQLSEVKASAGPAPGSYDAHASGAIASKKSFNVSVKSGAGGFGTSVVRGSVLGSTAIAVEATPGPGAYSSASTSGFAATSATAKPSAAFASTSSAGSRLATIDVSTAPSGPSYDAHSADGMAATAAKTFSKAAAAGRGLGMATRMEKVKEAAPGDYTDALPGAFTASRSHSTLSNVGFGGTLARSSLFEDAAAATQAPDTYYVGGGAFTKASEVSGPSAAFASKSKQLSEVKASAGPAPGSYDAHASGAIASKKSFNVSVKSGAGGFGTSAKRTAFDVNIDGEAPGPGSYDATDGGDLFSRDTFKPSAAFASTTEVRPQLLATAAPSGVSYDPYKDDGMAAQATRTFNTKAGTGGFGGQMPRRYHDVKHTPGPGEYSGGDPNAPSLDSNLNVNKGIMTGAFASSSLRDADDWVTGSMFNR